MKKLIGMLFIVTIVLVLGACGGPKFVDGIHDMGGKKFDENVEKEFLLYYYATSCSYCQKFRPTLNEYAKKENALPIYAIDGDDKETHDTYQYFIEEKGWDLRGTPTIYHIKDGKSLGKFEGIMEIDQIPVKGE